MLLAGSSFRLALWGCSKKGTEAVTEAGTSVHSFKELHCSVPPFSRGVRDKQHFPQIPKMQAKAVPSLKDVSCRSINKHFQVLILPVSISSTRADISETTKMKEMDEQNKVILVTKHLSDSGHNLAIRWSFLSWTQFSDSSST